MIYYKTKPQDDPYYDLWNSTEWLFPFENKDNHVFPKILTVEPVNLCQLRCVYCDTRIMKRKSGQMSLKVMEKIVKEASSHGASIRFGGWGEALIHKSFDEMVKMCKEANVRTTVFTNGKLFTEKLMEKFCECGLDEIRFSGSGVDEINHEEIRKRSDYEKDFKEKIIMAYKIREKMKKNRPYFTIYTHVLDYNDGYLDEYKDSYIDFFIQYADKIDIDKTNFSRVKELDEVKKYYDIQTINEVYKPCVTLYHKFIIHWNGDVFACDRPYNFEKEYHLGNLEENNQTLYEMYHSDKIKDLRRKTGELKHENMSLCKDCYSNTEKYEELKEKYVPTTELA